MTVNRIHADANDRMSKALEAIKRELASIRTGKANASLLDGIKVDYYGTMTPLSQVSNISTPDPRLLGLNPQSDPNVIRLPIPPLTEDRRKDLVKLVKKTAEEGKVAIRNIRRDANDAFKKAEKDKEISEDESRKGQDKVQEITNEHIEKIDELVKHKEQEVMEV
jgi:ribosome recycling factor